MKCYECNEDYTKEFDEDFVNGECLPCRCQREYMAELEKEKKELERFNKKFKQDYDENTFWYACDQCEIQRDQLKGFPILKSNYDYVEMLNEEAKAEDWYWANRQPELFDELNDLPF